MTPIIGTIASSYAQSGNFDSIQSVKLTSTSSGVTFSNIPQTYKHLQLRCSQSEGLYLLTFNNVTSGVYSRAFGYGDGGTTSAIVSSAQTSINVMEFGNAGNQAINIIDILEYSSTSKTKTYYALCGKSGVGGGEIVIATGNFNNSNGITSIEITGGTAAVGSVFSLYGIKAA